MLHTIEALYQCIISKEKNVRYDENSFKDICACFPSCKLIGAEQKSFSKIDDTSLGNF